MELYRISDPKQIVVGAAIIHNTSAHLLIAQRHSTDPYVGGLWEFPGGKVEPGESLPACIAREIMEEIGIVIQVGDFFTQVEHAYNPHSVIALHAYLSEYVSGEPQPLHCQALQWVARDELAAFAFAPADIPIVEMLQQSGF